MLPKRFSLWLPAWAVLASGMSAIAALPSQSADPQSREQQITALEKENSMLESREAERFSTARIRGEAGELGLAMPNTEEPRLIEYKPGDVATAAARLAAAGG